ncbi:hypothetical protein GSH19_01725 [Lactobacillus sp. S2-2]|uniref:UPF0223 family protein n=1 Tax=Lactobacillus sp. S2-2 TaxID=2692917 RepID=UPI001F2E8CAE|nr:UPF0223 family protein [Lactobacillus sp. S2-2]MCF6514882.1 hypothetical protein [Lactobacillus sp. S2-2]
MDKNFSYPIVEDWTRKEMVDVISFFTGIEDAYENGIKKNNLINLYNRFKEINPSKVEQRKLQRDFENESGYSVYPVLKKIDDDSQKVIKM